MIYFDNAATTQINALALEELYTKSRKFFGNPSTKYSIGVDAKKILNQSRKKISKLLNCNSTDIFFTSGGTEANNIIIQSLCKNTNKKIHIICSAIEHDSILNVIKNIKHENLDVSFVMPNKDGIIPPESVEKEIRNTTILVCVQMINNEIGTIQPIKEIANVVHKHGIKLHVDAVQAVGHIAIDIENLKIDFLSASAHKFGGPKGIGFLFSKEHNIGLCFGGGQEKNVKSGTENVPSICSMAVALEQALINIEEKKSKILSMITFLKTELKKINSINLNVNNDNYSSILSFRIKGVSNESLINFFDINHVFVSAGSACSGNSFERSHVLKALGLSNEEIDSSIRISLSCNNTISECKLFIKLLKKGISLLKNN